MLRYAVTFGLALLLAAFVGRSYVGEAKAEHDWRMDQCRYQSLQAGTWTPREEYLTAQCAVQKWIPGSFGRFSSVADCESNWDRFANNHGNYVGLFQHDADSYVGRVRQYGPSSYDLSTRWRNSRGQIVTTARMISAVGWSPWAGCD